MGAENRADKLLLPSVEVETHAQVAVLTLGRPEASNAMNVELLEDLAKAMAWCNQADHLRAIIVTGAGRAFSVGGDLEALRVGVGDKADGHRGPGWLAAELGKSIVLIDEMRCPVIAAINGRAGGAGFSLALACDLRVASERAVFDFAYHRIGATPDGGMTWFLPLVVGSARARELLIQVPIIRAQQALEERLVSCIVPSTELMNVARKMALRLARQPPHYLAAVKQLSRASGSDALAAHLAEEQRWLESSLLAEPGRGQLLGGQD